MGLPFISFLECSLLLLKVRPMISVKNRHKSLNQCSRVWIYKKRDPLRPDGGDENDKGSDSTKEDALHLRIVRNDLRLPVLNDRSFHVVPAYRLDLRRCR